MRNDARPIGEEFRDIAEHDLGEHPPEGAPDEPAGARPESKPFVVNRDPAEEPSDASDR